MVVTSEIYYSTNRTSNLTTTLVEIKYGFSRFVPLCRKGNINYVANSSKQHNWFTKQLVGTNFVVDVWTRL